MADPRTARPVSGEIMAGEPLVPRSLRPESRRDDLVEADFEVVSDASLMGVGAHQMVPSMDARGDTFDGMELLRGADASAGSRGGLPRGGPVFWMFGIAAVLAAFWMSGGHSIVSAAVAPPTTASGPMLVISDVVSRVDVSGPKPLLFVDGQAGNSGGAVAVMSELEIQVIGNDGRVTRYNLGTSGRTMAPGEKFAFSSRLDVPKNGVKHVSVSFAE